MAVERLRCRECGEEVQAGPEYVCGRCFGPLEAVYDLEALRRLGPLPEHRRSFAPVAQALTDTPEVRT